MDQHEQGAGPRGGQGAMQGVRGYLVALAAVAAAVAAGFLLLGRNNTADVVMVFLLGIVVVAMRCGLRPSLFAAGLSVLSFDVFFIPPYYSFAVSDFRHVVTFAVMLFVAVVISGLAQRVREQAAAAREREWRTAQLYALSRELSRAQDSEALVRSARHHFETVFEARVVVLEPDERGALRATVTSQGADDLAAKDRAAAQAAWSKVVMAGKGTRRHPDSRALWLPLSTARAGLGVIGLFAHAPRAFDDASWREYADAFATQLSMAMERAALAREREQARVQIESEKLRNSLLSSVSHDLRTPLAVMTGAASTLLDDRSLPDDATRRQLLDTICSEGQRLDHLIHNLLEMTRLESGKVQVSKERQSIEEVVGSALQRLERKLGTRKVVIDLPATLPLAPFDGVLIEQVLINLVENAIKYAGDDSPIEICARASDTHLTVEVADRGPGLAPGEELQIFEKFHRARRSGATGAGLGLAICRGILTAHEGTIVAENRPEGGARFRFELPMDGRPPSSPMPMEGS